MERVTVIAHGNGPRVWLIGMLLRRSVPTPFDIYWRRPSAYGFILSVTKLILNNKHKHNHNYNMWHEWVPDIKAFLLQSLGYTVRFGSNHSGLGTRHQDFLVTKS